MTDILDTNLPDKTEDMEVKKAPEVSEQQNAEPVAGISLERTTEHAPMQTKEAILARLRTIAENAASVPKAEIDSLKQAYYRLSAIGQEAELKQFIDEGGTVEAFVRKSDPMDNELGAVLSVIKDKRNKANAELEKLKEQNLQIKLSIIEKLKELVEASDNPNKQYPEFKKLQQQWNEAKIVPQAKANELWKNYQLYVEKFYDLMKLNNEFREYDFKKNLERKTQLCEAAEALADEPDIISAYNQLQDLHSEFREVGPVAKELREEVWGRFKAASTVINKKHQQYYDDLKMAEQHNLDQKTVICEIIEAFDLDSLKTVKAWADKMREVDALQEKWKSIGRAPQKMNAKIVERYRKARDVFFKKKNEFFKTFKAAKAENLEKKLALCEKAEALKDSTDWKNATDELIKLQKEWKTIGNVSKKDSEAIWKRFISACDYFFERKNSLKTSQQNTEQENLAKKKAIISKLEAINENMDAEEAAGTLRELMKEWNAVGHVPFKEKDKLYKQYRNVTDNLFERLNLSASDKKLGAFRSAIGNLQDNGGGQALYRERERLVRAYESMKSELMTYENNLGFLNASSQKGNSLLAELNRKVEKLKSDIELMRQKIQVLDDSAKAEEQ